MIIPFIPSSIEYNTDQFDMLNDELHIQHLHTDTTNRWTAMGVDTESNPGVDCTFSGFQSGMTNSHLAGTNIGTNNTYYGSKAGKGTLTGSAYASFANSGFGNYSLELVSGGFRNLAAGYYPLRSPAVGTWPRSPGSYNVALGAFCGWSMIGGHNNMAQGFYALGKGKFPVENVIITALS